MSPANANIGSVEIPHQVKIALLQFMSDALLALEMLEMEGRKPLQWIDHDLTRYWPREAKKSSDALSEARVALNRAQMKGDEAERGSCIDERKALEQARRRLSLCEDKVDVVRRWRGLLHKEVEEFIVQVSRFKRHLEQDCPQAIATLERLSEALHKYVQTPAPPTGVEP
jgi:hypothetical protein